MTETKRPDYAAFVVRDRDDKKANWREIGVAFRSARSTSCRSRPSPIRSRCARANGNAYSQPTESGEFNLRVANNGGAGHVEPSSLDGSNVDLGQEFTSMIVTQRAYGANAKTITTADEMLQELMQIKR